VAGSSGAPVKRALLTVTGVVATAALCLAGLAFRPIEATVVIAAAGVAAAVVALRAPRGQLKRAGAAGMALGCLAVLALYWTSALVHLEPDHVEDGSFASVGAPLAAGTASLLLPATRAVSGH